MLETCTKTLMCKQPRHACLRCSGLKHASLDLLCKRAFSDRPAALSGLSLCILAVLSMQADLSLVELLRGWPYTTGQPLLIANFLSAYRCVYSWTRLKHGMIILKWPDCGLYILFGHVVR